MKPELILAIVAIVIAVFNRPIELMWDKIIEHRKVVGFILKSMFNVFIRFGLPIVGMLYTYYMQPLGKSFVFFMCTFSILLLFNLMMIQLRYNLERIEKLEKYWITSLKNHLNLVNEVDTLKILNAIKDATDKMK